MTSPSPHAERRRADRAAASFPVRISNKPDAEPAMLRDISEIGLACLSSHEVPEMTLVGLDFALPGATELVVGNETSPLAALPDVTAAVRLLFALRALLHLPFSERELRRAAPEIEALYLEGLKAEGALASSFGPRERERTLAREREQERQPP